MSDCLKCSYTRGEEKGARVCRKCGRPENVPKGQYVPMQMTQGPVEVETLPPLASYADDPIMQPDRMLHPGATSEVGQVRPTPAAIVQAEPATLAAVALPVAATTLPAHSSSEAGQARPTEGASAVVLEAAPVVRTAAILPAHSRMGGSAAHRFLNCSGSTALIAGLKLGESDDPDWTRDGTVAHALGARCLEEDADAWELVSQFPLPPDQATAVQEYIDVVRSMSGRRRVEVKIHLPDLHPLMFSTLDMTLNHALGDIALTVLDYKHGEGVYVGVVENEQLMYYACMAIMERAQDFDNDDKVQLGICQPRITWTGETTRWWITTVGELKHWLYEVLLPAMRLEAQDMHLQMGEWCRFCPAKLVCPAMSQAFLAFAGATTELAALSDEVLGRDYALTATVKMRIAAIQAEVFRRQMEGIEVPGSKLVLQKTDRVWKDDAPIVDYWKQDAWQPLKLISPAQAEKLPAGKEFVSEWAYKPEAGYTVALADDPRAAVVPKTPEDKYGPASKLLDAIGRGVA